MEKKKNFTISVYTENNVGLLHRLSAIFLKRHINIESFSTSESEIKDVFRFIIVVKMTKSGVEKVVKQIDAIETFVEDKSNLVRTNIIDQKNNLQSEGLKAKTRWVLHLKDIKNVKVKDAFPASKPRYSYWPKVK